MIVPPPPGASFLTNATPGLAYDDAKQHFAKRPGLAETLAPARFEWVAFERWTNSGP